MTLFSLTGKDGIPLRAKVDDFGAALMSRLLNLNETQTGVMTIVFEYCKDQNKPLIDLRDLKSALTYISGEGISEVVKKYGALSGASVGTILRQVLQLETEGGGTFFGEPSLDLNDLIGINNGKGMISLINLKDVQDKPRLFSTLMLFLLVQTYASFPEVGDLDKPKFVLMIDEAHLLFEGTSKVLLDKLEGVVRLIRSKGVGVFFCTQSPTDLPKSILGQLGLKVQHALRAFTANDRKAIKLASENFPTSKYYKTDDMLTKMAIGEALVTGLNERGVPTPLVETMIRSPESEMGPLSDADAAALINASLLLSKYKMAIMKEGAFEKTGGAGGVSWEFMVNNPIFKKLYNTLIREVTNKIIKMIGLKK